MPRFKFHPPILFAEEDGAGSGELPDSVVKAFERLMEKKGGDASAVAQMLFHENKQYRDKINDLTGKVPAEGMTVVSSSDAADLEAYRALGPVAEVKQGLDQRTQLQQQLDATQRESALHQVAEAAGFKASVLTQLDRMAKAQGKDLAFELRETQVDGKTVKTPYVKDGEAQQSLAEYAAAQWADFMPALAQTGGTSPQAPGTRFPAQHPGGGNAQAPDIVTQFVNEQAQQAKAAKNPLLKS